MEENWQCKLTLHGYSAPRRMLINVFSTGDTAKCHSLTNYIEVPDLRYYQSTGKQCPGLDCSSARIQLLFIWHWAQAHCESHLSFVVHEVYRKRVSKVAWESHYGTSWVLPGGLRCFCPHQNMQQLHTCMALTPGRGRCSTGATHTVWSRSGLQQDEGLHWSKISSPRLTSSRMTGLTSFLSVLLFCNHLKLKKQLSCNIYLGDKNATEYPLGRNQNHPIGLPGIWMMPVWLPDNACRHSSCRW